ncbi:MAG: iron response transcriptional regulator IrrA [Minwuia sp.]|uniref:iron response transcriptional regulator IrrA n=1 Tax=Minwuia sp. TaxID=2493630 RepID=UPI003A842695
MSSVEMTDISQRLRAARLRPTRQRMALAELLYRQGDRHVTAEQLYDEALRDGVAVSLATVYNCLNQFTRAGLIREVVVDPGRSYFDTNVSQHHHFYHDRTGQLTDIPGEAIRLGDLPAAPDGTRVASAEVIIRLTDAAPLPDSDSQ